MKYSSPYIKIYKIMAMIYKQAELWRMEDELFIDKDDFINMGDHNRKKSKSIKKNYI